MNTENIIDHNLECKISKFWSGVNIFIFNQHCVNRRLSGTINEVCVEFSCELTNQIDYFNKLKNIDLDLNNFIESVSKLFKNVKVCDLEKIRSSYTDDKIYKKFMVLHKLIPRSYKIHKSCYTVSLIDFSSASVYFQPPKDVDQNIAPLIPFSISYSDNLLSISTSSSTENLSTASSTWLKFELFPKLLKWISNQNDKNDDVVRSQKLVPIEEYSRMYSQLKIKYGTELVKIWPETTDPSKYVYEDIAIACYLILLWRDERDKLGLEKKQSFVDLGCGNGLLVYLLIMEGHPGFGIDLRRRKIWDMYPEIIKLNVESMIPSTAKFPEIDWVIGNHSDELSPWIPVIAARSSYKCKFFLLPCCAYEFDGRKYQRSVATKSQYGDFLDYVTEISQVCGFNTTIDRLKIPSTKRTAVIGDSRNHSEFTYNENLGNIQEFIDQKTQTEFVPRESVESVKNCTQIEKSVQHDIVKLVFDKLLSIENFDLTIYGKWNLGGSFPLVEIITEIPLAWLKKLKSECGGLQTLLRNHNQVFQVSKGEVKLRPPTKLTERLTIDKNNGKSYGYKKKLCWFLNHHPNGCPFSDSDCSFKHEIENDK